MRFLKVSVSNSTSPVNATVSVICHKTAINVAIKYVILSKASTIYGVFIKSWYVITVIQFF